MECFFSTRTLLKFLGEWGKTFFQFSVVIKISTCHVNILHSFFQGMVMTATVASISDYKVVVCLPFYLHATLAITNISAKFTELLRFCFNIFFKLNYCVVAQGCIFCTRFIYSPAAEYIIHPL